MQGKFMDIFGIFKDFDKLHIYKSKKNFFIHFLVTFFLT